MNIQDDLRYTRDHEWVKVVGNEGTVGITDYAQGELGDIVYVDLPDIGAAATQGETFGTIEAVKAAADLYAPISGEVIAVNGNLDQEPELINRDPYGDGWMVRVKLSHKGDLDTLMNAAAYRKFVESAGKE